MSLLRAAEGRLGKFEVALLKMSKGDLINWRGLREGAWVGLQLLGHVPLMLLLLCDFSYVIEAFVQIINSTREGGRCEVLIL